MKYITFRNSFQNVTFHNSIRHYFAMKHQLKITLANIRKSRHTSALNLIGLSSAFAAFILIMLYVWNEYQFDRYHENAENIYRVEFKDPEGSKTGVFLLGPTGETLVNEFSNIVNSTTYMPWGKWGEQPFSYESNTGIHRSYEDYAFADEHLTEVFTFDFICGPEQPLYNNETAMVNETFARKAWKDEDPLGKTINTGGNKYTVTAVFRDLPENSIFTSPIILKIPTDGFIGEARKSWNVTNYPQFIKTTKGTNAEELSTMINEISSVPSRYRFFDNGKTMAEIVARPISELRFTKEVAENPLFGTNNKMFVDSLFIVGILIILVAMINYINFATAHLPKRMKTFNINRIIGSSKWNSAEQMMLETILLYTMAFVIALTLAYYLNKSFSVPVLGYQIPFEKNVFVLVTSAIIALVGAFIAGIYPAIVSTTGKPIQSLKKTQSGINENLRGTFTVFQFAATIALLVSTLTVIKQVRFMENTDLGFNKEHTFVLPMFTEIKDNYSTFENEILASPHIKQMTCSRAVPGRGQEANVFTVDDQRCAVYDWAVGDGYMEMMDFDIIEGRGFHKNSEADKGNFICNETAAKKYNWKLGTKINDKQIVGIMKDFNLVSLRETIEPFVFHKAYSLDETRTISLKLNGNNTKEALADIKTAFEKFCPEIPFKGHFLDDELNMLYAKESQQSKLITFFSILSAIVSMLGILGLSIFMCQQKIKEIGIRKVNGAKISEVLIMLNKSFVKWVLIAFCLATPIAVWLMKQWLNNFTFKTELNWWLFAIAGFVALAIALLTVSFQSWKAAARNPVEALRYE